MIINAFAPVRSLCMAARTERSSQSPSCCTTVQGAPLDEHNTGFLLRFVADIIVDMSQLEQRYGSAHASY